jgi:hypothetical protein
MFKRWLIRLTDKWRLDSYEDCVPEPKQVRSRRWIGGSGGGGGSPTKQQQRVTHNYDDDGVITFKVYGANGGKIVEAARYDDKHDQERIKLYIIEENADFTESLSRIVTMEYLR